MAQTYTLDEAARKLNISPEDLKRRLRDDWKHVRSFRDGPTLRFRAADIDELARTLGIGSDPEGPGADESSIPMDLGADDSGPQPASKSTSKSSHPPDEAPLLLGGDDVFVLAPEEPPKSGSGRIAKPAAKSDSDVRLEKPAGKKSSADDQESILTEEIQIDLPASSKSGKLTGKSGRHPKPGDSGKKKGSDSGKKSGAGKKPDSGTKLPAPIPEEDSSEFELSLEPASSPSSDEFELSINTSDSSEEIGLGDTPKAKSGNSGINLSNPSDSGPSLEKKKAPSKPAAGSDEEIDFELSLDSGSSKKIVGSSGRKKKKGDAESDSEFELTLDDAGDLAANLDAETSSFVTDEPKGDIFETDFEIPALEESGSEVVSLEDADTDLESSDFDLALDDSDVQAEDESGSEAVVVDEEGSAPSRRRRRRAADDEVEDDAGAVDLDDMDLEEGASASAALRGVSREDVEADEDGEPGEVVVAAPAQWGALPGVLLIFCVFFMFIGGIMGYELLNNMWGYHQPQGPSGLVVEQVADMFGVAPDKK